MKLLVITTIYLLMFALGMSLSLRELLRRWRAQSALNWTRLLLVTFIIPPALALLLSHIFRLTGPETAGLFMIGCAPGAPLLMLNVSRKGFNANRHAGLALFITANFLRLQKSIPAVACYALIAPVVMIVYAKLFPAVKAEPASVESARGSGI